MHYLQKIFAAFLVISLTSCSTVFLKKTYQLRVRATTSARAKIYDSIYELPAKVTVKRSKEDLPIVLINDSIQKSYVVKPAVSPNFVFGNLALFHFAPLGWAVDLTNQKRFHYGYGVHLDFDDTLTVLRPPIGRATAGFMQKFNRKFPTSKGQLNLAVSSPVVSGYSFAPKGEQRKQPAGCMGLAIGIEYYLNQNKFIALNAGITRGFDLPFPLTGESFGAYEDVGSFSVGLTQNHKLYRFILGYGIQYSKNTWELINDEYDRFSPEDEDDYRMPVKKTNYNLGLVGSSYFQLSPHFFVGVNYKPSLYKLNSSQGFQYEHVLSFEAIWKLRLKNRGIRRKKQDRFAARRKKKTS